VRVLIDECLPRYFEGSANWACCSNGASGWLVGDQERRVLVLAEAEYDVFLTADQNLRYQQNLSKRKIAIIELPTNTLSVVKTLVYEILKELTTIGAGDYVQIKTNRFRA
jgi:hypothetical protein